MFYQDFMDHILCDISQTYASDNLEIRLRDVLDKLRLFLSLFLVKNTDGILCLVTFFTVYKTNHMSSLVTQSSNILTHHPNPACRIAPSEFKRKFKVNYSHQTKPPSTFFLPRSLGIAGLWFSSFYQKLWYVNCDSIRLVLRQFHCIVSILPQVPMCCPLYNKNNNNMQNSQSNLMSKYCKVSPSILITYIPTVARNITYILAFMLNKMGQ